MSVNRDKALSNSTTSNFVTALVVNGALLGVEVVGFLILKQKLWRIYSPRTVLPPPELVPAFLRQALADPISFSKRAPALPSGPAKWLPALLRYPAEDIVSYDSFHPRAAVLTRVLCRYIRMDLMRMHQFPMLSRHQVDEF